MAPFAVEKWRDEQERRWHRDGQVELLCKDRVGRNWDRVGLAHSFNLGTEKVKAEMCALAAAFEGMRVEAHRDPSRGKSRDAKHLVSDNS